MTAKKPVRTMTISVPVEMIPAITEYCKEKGLKVSTKTVQMWRELIEKDGSDFI